jgi:hypothetical protein
MDIPDGTKIDYCQGSVRRLLYQILKEKKEKILKEGVSLKEKQERENFREKKYVDHVSDERELKHCIIVTNGYAFDSKTGKVWKSNIKDGYHARQSKLIGK